MTLWWLISAALISLRGFLAKLLREHGGGEGRIAWQQLASATNWDSLPNDHTDHHHVCADGSFTFYPCYLSILVRPKTRVLASSWRLNCCFMLLHTQGQSECSLFCRRGCWSARHLCERWLHTHFANKGLTMTPPSFG